VKENNMTEYRGMAQEHPSGHLSSASERLSTQIWQISRFTAAGLGLFLLCSFSAPMDASPPQRIASLSLASDEILLDILPKCGGRQRLIALSTFADDPDSSSVVDSAKSVKARVHSEPESLFSLKPDLIIAASFNRPELIQMIQSKKIPLLVLAHFSSANDIADHIRDIGAATVCDNEARALIDSFWKQVTPQAAPMMAKTTAAKISVAKTSLPIDKKRSEDRDAPKKRLRVINYSPDLTIMGQDTLFEDLVIRAGGINVGSELGLRHWPRIDAETLLRAQPDKIVVLGADTLKMRATIKSDPAWGRLNAVMKGHDLIFLDQRSALSTSHYFSRAVTELREKLNPKHTGP
jgi:iron complex transport system substrate-binding protein